MEKSEEELEIGKEKKKKEAKKEGNLSIVTVTSFKILVLHT